MTKTEQQCFEIISRLLRIIAEEMEDQPDHILMDHCQHVYEATRDAVFFLRERGVEPPLEAAALLGQFIRASRGYDD